MSKEAAGQPTRQPAQYPAQTTPPTQPAGTDLPGPAGTTPPNQPQRQVRGVGWQAPASAMSVLGWGLLALACYPRLVGADGARLFKLDAWIYRTAVEQWRAGGSLYDWYANPEQHLWPFTYPPFAAWAMWPLSLLPAAVVEVLMTLTTPLAVAATAWAMAQALGYRGTLLRPGVLAPWVALVGVAVLEPVYKTMEYGQVNAILMALVAVDVLAVPQHSRWRGVCCGLAAAFKLTPAIAILVFLARREWRAALTMVGSAGLVTTLSAAAAPRETWQFFTSAMWDPSRAGFAEYAGNQNLKGLVARALPESWWTPAWAVLSLAAVLLTWVLLRRLARVPMSDAGAHLGPERAPESGVVLALELGVTMTCGLLISPISWSHHWVWCVVALWALAVAAWQWGEPGLGVCAAAGMAVFVLAMQWWFPNQNHLEYGWSAWQRLVGSSYTWWALASGIVLWRLTRRREHA